MQEGPSAAILRACYYSSMADARSVAYLILMLRIWRIRGDWLRQVKDQEARLLSVML